MEQPLEEAAFGQEGHYGQHRQRPKDLPRAPTQGARVRLVHGPGQASHALTAA